MTDSQTEQPTTDGQQGPHGIRATLGQGSIVGRYRIIRLIGEGGMGAVYEAEQERPHRTIALKVIRPGLSTPELLRRFEQESEALGRLQHAGIAQIHEAGTADAGFGPQPYFAMEFIRGRSLREYIKERHLNTRDRLEVMAKVCEAVHHAHQRGLIHRDLKPGNILVDETGQPKILDFGVARVTDSDTRATLHTYVGEIVGTLPYMSPEQVLADPLEIDRRSDVYALGVILYELLADRLPYTISRKLHEAVQTIREEDPLPLSSISPAYRGDIETIVAIALEKDKSRRYASAAALAADIQRYLNDEPVIARPPSVTYQVQKFARRHKALVTGVAAVFVVLVAGIIGTTWQAARATQERNLAVAEKQRADTEAAIAKAVNEFLQNDLLAQASANMQARPNTKPDPDLKVRTALDRAAMRIASRFEQQPLVEASIRQTIGSTYRDLGVYPEAEQQIGRALDLRRRVLGKEHPSTLASMSGLGQVYLLEGKYAQAEPLLTNVRAYGRRVWGEAHPDTLLAMNDLAELYRLQGKYEQAEPLILEVLNAQRRSAGEEHPDTLETMNNLGVLYRLQAKYDQAEPLYTRILDVRRRTLGEEHPETLVTGNDLALLYRYQGRYAEAEALFLMVVEVMRRVLGEEHLETLISMGNLGIVYFSQRKYEQTEPLFTMVMEIKRRVLGVEHPETLTSLNNLAVLFVAQGRYTQAEALYNQVVNIQDRVLGEEHPNSLASMNGLAKLYQRRGKYAQGEALLTKALEIQRRVLGQEHPATLASMTNLAALYESWGKPEKVTEWREKVETSKAAAAPVPKP
jgi:tetratricopeptide (TPR) repeat protein